MGGMYRGDDPVALRAAQQQGVIGQPIAAPAGGAVGMAAPPRAIADPAMHQPPGVPFTGAGVPPNMPLGGHTPMPAGAMGMVAPNPYRGGVAPVNMGYAPMRNPAMGRNRLR